MKNCEVCGKEGVMESVSVNGQTMYVCDLSPIRKSKALVMKDTVGKHRVLAYFRTDDAAKVAEFWLDRLAQEIKKKGVSDGIQAM